MNAFQIAGAVFAAIILGAICYLYYTQIAYYYDWERRRKAEKLREEETAKGISENSTPT